MKKYYVLIDKEAKTGKIYTTKVDICYFAGISPRTLTRSEAKGEYYNGKRYVICLVEGINKNMNRVKQGNEANLAYKRT